MNAVLHRFLKNLAVLQLIVALAGCPAHEVDSSAAPSPSNDYWLSPIELTHTLSAANDGDVRAMQKLVDYYWVNQDNGAVEGAYWLERTADTGDIEARKEIIGYYESKPSQAMKSYGEALKKKWEVHDPARHSMQP